MIPPGTEIASSLRSAWRLLFLDAAAMRGFNLTIEGFWRSFFAVVFGIPYYFVLATWSGTGPEGESLSSGPDPWSLALAVVLSWTIFPLVAAVLARVMDLGRNYVAYIVANNWAAALTPQVYLVLALLQRSGVIGDELHGMLQFVAAIGMLWYAWAVCRIALGAGAVAAAGFVILANLIDILLTVLLLAPPAP